MILRTTLLLVTLCFTGLVIAAPEEKIIDGVTYRVLRAHPQAIRVIWVDAEGNQLRTFPEVARYLATEKIELDTLMNGGIFEPGGVPSGLLVQDGRELRPVNRNEGKGNFFLKPNGIFRRRHQPDAIRC